MPKEGRALTQAETQQLFLPYRSFCARKGVIITIIFINFTGLRTETRQMVVKNHSPMRINIHIEGILY